MKGIVIVSMILLFVSSIALAQESTEVIINQIDQLLESGEYEKAIALNRQLRLQEPANSDHIYREAMIYYEMARRESGGVNPYYQTAIQLLDETITVAQQQRMPVEAIVELYNNKASIHWEFGNYRNSMEEAQKVLQLDPNNAMAHYNIGNAWMWLGFLVDPQSPPENYVKQAIYYYEEAIELNQGKWLMPYAYYFAGVIRYHKNDLETSEKYLLTFLYEMVYIEEVLNRQLSNYDLRIIDIAIRIIEEIQEANPPNLSN